MKDKPDLNHTDNSRKLHEVLTRVCTKALESGTSDEPPSAAWGTVALNLLKADGYLEYVRGEVLDALEGTSDIEENAPFPSPKSTSILSSAGVPVFEFAEAN